MLGVQLLCAYVFAAVLSSIFSISEFLQLVHSLELLTRNLQFHIGPCPVFT